MKSSSSYSSVGGRTACDRNPCYSSGVPTSEPKAVKDEIRALLSQGSELQLQRARKQIRAQLTHFPYDADLHNLNAQVSIQLGQFDDAAAASKTALALAPEEPGFSYTAGVIFMFTHNFREAVAAFERVLALQPGNGDALVHLAFARANLGSSERAEVAAIIDRAASSVLSLMALPLLASAALRCQLVDQALDAVCAVYAREHNLSNRAPWPQALHEVPDAFIKERFPHSIVRPGQADMPASDPIRLAKELIVDGASRPEVLDTLYSYLSDEIDDDQDDAELAGRVKNAAASGEFQVYVPGPRK